MPTYLVVHHASAESRQRWPREDRLRPLSGKGEAQALALADGLSEIDIVQIRSSPAVRCFQTIEPLSERLGQQVVVDDSLMEGCQINLPNDDGVHVLCAHGDNIPDLLNRMEVHWHEYRKASIWMLKCDDFGEVIEVAYVEPPEI